MNIKTYIITKKLNSYYKKAIEEYEKRLQLYAKTSITLVKSESVLKKKLNSNYYTILVSPDGKNLSSTSLASHINTLGIQGTSNINFVIAENIVDLNFDEIISLSQMSINVSLTSVILYEQIYRAYRIINNHSYHK